MATKGKSKKNKTIDCTCTVESTDIQGNNIKSGDKIKAGKCVCIRKPGGKELKGVGKLNLNIA